MDITLSDDDVLTLRSLLHDYLPELKFEAARTDTTELRHVLLGTSCETACRILRGLT